MDLQHKTRVPGRSLSIGEDLVLSFLRSLTHVGGCCLEQGQGERLMHHAFL